MIKKFDSSTAMLLVDVQRGVNDTFYYGGSNEGGTITMLKRISLIY